MHRPRVLRQRKRRKTMLLQLVKDGTLLHSGPMSRTFRVNGVCAATHATILCPLDLTVGDCAPLITYVSNGMSAEYDRSGRKEKDAASLADDPAPDCGLAIYYFEITVENACVTCRVGLGLCESSVKLDKMPG